ncbi:PTS sugar transporter [Suicoccus acidiformans]|uniref:PTS sugar transporter n=1 Tax=Suicoccus acidiformans TaxID=2036206 RepID=A0A347WIU1_9LACT|nr:PTS transporter subunit EIIC [Suicoccus acidiformans]AXY24998.1 PTS sugar transporter [Suicoccus acidiformans]
MDYGKTAKRIVKGVGGADNIASVYHCVTRLRFTLKDNSKVDRSLIESTDGVMSVVDQGGQFQVVIGQTVGNVYEAMEAYLNENVATSDNESSKLKSASEVKDEMKDKKVSNSFLATISGIFTPILGVLTASGVLKGVLALLTATQLLSTESGTYILLDFIASAFLKFLPVVLGYTSMKRFGGDPFVGMTLGAALMFPTIPGLLEQAPLYTLFAGTPFQSDVHLTFLGVPIILMDYSGSVIPVIFTTWFATKFEKFFKKHVPDMFSLFGVPLLTLLSAGLLGFLIVGPVSQFVSNLLGLLMAKVFEVSGTLGGFLYGLLIQFAVIFGVHWGFVALSINNIATLGFDPVTITGLTSAFGQAGVVLVIMLKTKDKKLKQVAQGGFFSALFGVTEPAIYGVTLQNRRAFWLASVASAVGGAIMGFFGAKQYVYGTNGIFGWLQVINPETGFDASVWATIAACAISFVLAIVFMLAFGKVDEEAVRDK